MYQQHFGLTHIPFGKGTGDLWESAAFLDFKTQFNDLLNAPGIGVLTGEPGVGKTAAIRHVAGALNPHQYKVFYLPESHFTSFDIYRQMAYNLGITPASRYSRVWRDVKGFIKDSVENKRCRPIFIIDEAQNLPFDFLRNFPSFMNFEFDAQDMLTVWFIGHPEFANTLKLNAHIALASRIRVRCAFQPIMEREQFTQMIEHAFKAAGCQTKLLSDSGIEILRTSSQGRLRLIHYVIATSMQLAQQRNLNHLPDEILMEAINKLKG